MTEKFWELERRFWKRTEVGFGSTPDEETTAWTRFCLGTDGALFVRVEQWTDVYQKPGGLLQTVEEPRVWEMTDEDVLTLDFHPKEYSSDGVITNRERGALKHHAKGVGLSLALKRLLDA